MALYSDDFNRPNSTNIGNWVEHDDDFSINSNQLAPGTTSTGFVLYASPLDSADHYSEIVMSNATASSMGAVARADVDGNNFYLWRSNGTSWELFYNVGGSFNSLGTYSATLVNGDVGRIQCVGSTIKGFVNGVERLSVTDTNITTGLYAGVRSAASSTARYDNFLAGDVVADSDIGAFFDFITP